MSDLYLHEPFTPPEKGGVAHGVTIGVNGERDYWTHQIAVTDDDRDVPLFRWHFPRKVLDQRMSALELAEFLMPHLPAVVPMMATMNERCAVELALLLQRFLTFPKVVLDEISPWIRVLPATEEDCVVEMSMGGKLPTPAGPRYFV